VLSDKMADSVGKQAHLSSSPARGTRSEDEMETDCAGWIQTEYSCTRSTL